MRGKWSIYFPIMWDCKLCGTPLWRRLGSTSRISSVVTTIFLLFLLWNIEVLLKPHTEIHTPAVAPNNQHTTNNGTKTTWYLSFFEVFLHSTTQTTQQNEWAAQKKTPHCVREELAPHAWLGTNAWSLVNHPCSPSCTFQSQSKGPGPHCWHPWEPRTTY